jgi:hypothetical protein
MAHRTPIVPVLLATAVIAAGVCAADNAPAKTVATSSAQKAADRIFGDTLSGHLPKTVKASRGPYVITADIDVPQGKTVIIEPGTVFLFHNFTGLKVQGTLLAQGTSDNPVVFTSINDRQYNPQSPVDAAPYDWNGIYIYEEGIGTCFSYCTIFYSVYGINALTKYIRIEPSLFKNNGRSNLTIENKEIAVGDKPFEYSLTVKDAASNGVPLTILRDPNSTKRALFRYGGISLAAAGCVVGILYTSKFSSSLSSFNQISGTDAANLSSGTSGEWQNRRGGAVINRFWMISGYTLAAIGAAGIGWSFTF